MRKWIAFAVLSISTPVCAQNSGSTSGASSEIYFSYPSSTTSKSRLTTPPTVVAPGLAAAGIETCLGSASGGISMMGGGLTFGGTKVDDGCTIRLLARQLFAFGFQKAAVALMCQDERVAAAMGAAGSPCPVAPAEARDQRRRSEQRNLLLRDRLYRKGGAPAPLRGFGTGVDLALLRGSGKDGEEAPVLVFGAGRERIRLRGFGIGGDGDSA